MSMPPHADELSNASSNEGRRDSRQPSLLFVGMDAEVVFLLCERLNGRSVPYAADGLVVHARLPEEQAWELLEGLVSEFSEALKARIRAAWVRGGHSLEQLVAACASAQPLGDLLDLRDAAWLPAALEEGRLYSVFQPIVDARAGSVHGYEAFMRAHRPDGSEHVRACQLLYMATRLGLRHATELQAARAAFAGAAGQGLRTSLLFVNISPMALYEPLRAMEHLLEKAAAVGILPSQIVFDVPDTSEPQDAAVLSRWCACCRERGVRVALEQVTGTERSLDLVRLTAPDYVKSDGVLVPGGLDGRGRRRLNRLVQVAAEVGTQVVAEGIETPVDARICLEAGVYLLQGYLFGQPSLPPVARLAELSSLVQAA